MLITPNHYWECPNCPLEDITHEAQPHTRFHNCSGLKGLSAPMVPKGTKCKVEAVEREDYVKNENVVYDEDGRAIMAIETTRDSGNDVAVYAPCVNSNGKVGS